MAGEPMPFRNPAGHAGLLSNVLSLLNGLAGFIESRLALFTSEGKTALVHFAVLAACIVGALLLCAFGFIFLIASLVVGIAHALGTSWVWIGLGAAVVHFLLAFVCIWIARGRLKTPVFRTTAAELKKDREWLKNLDKKSLSTP